VNNAADYKHDFIRFMMETDVLRFGDFVTKSGRNTPYFINTGLYRTGSQISRLGEFYARAILDRLGTDFDVLFGPAYKGIPLVVTTAAALSEHGHDVAYCFNRKEVKDHGERGLMVGHELADGDRVLIVEDITTAGTAIRETVPLLRAQADISLAGLVVSVNRCERASDQALDARAALDVLAEEFQMPTFAIVDVHDIMANAPLREAELSAMRQYLEQYGA